MKGKLELSLDESSSASLYEQVGSELRRVILSGILAPGEQLPSVRELSRQLNVSIATVRRAVGELVEQGLLELKVGSGTYVSQTAKLRTSWLRSAAGAQGQSRVSIRRKILEFDADDSNTSGQAPAIWACRMDRCFDQTRFYARYDEPVDIDFRVGTPPFDLFLGHKWEETLLRWARESLIYSKGQRNPAGILELREKIASWLTLSRGIECSADDVFVVSGAQQARNLVARLLVSDGTRIGFEEPGSIFARLMFEAYGAEPVPVSVDDSGLVVDELEKTAGLQLLYVTPSAQFPSGAVLSQARRKKLVQWAKEQGTVIVEDDNNSEFVYESRIVPAIQSFAGAEQTIYIGTFSQIIMPSWRVGYMVVPKRMREPVFRLKWLSDRCTSAIVQQLALRLFVDGLFEQHLQKAHEICQQRRDTLLRELETWPTSLIRFTPVKGGLHQTVWLPTQINDIEVFDRCFEQKLGVLPVSPCYLTKPARPGLMLNFSALSVEKIREGLSQLKEILIKLYGS